jgi:hypothetical protein
MILAPSLKAVFAAPINPLAFTYYIYETSDPAASGEKSWGKTNLSPFMITLENAECRWRDVLFVLQAAPPTNP